MTDRSVAKSSDPDRENDGGGTGTPRPDLTGELGPSPLQKVVDVADRYELEIRGEPGPVLTAAFPELQLRPHHGMTLLHGEFVDQAALHGVIERINSLGLELVNLHLVDDDAEPTGAELDRPNQRSQ